MKQKDGISVEEKFFSEEQNTINSTQFTNIAKDLLFKYDIPVEEIEELFDFIDVH